MTAALALAAGTSTADAHALRAARSVELRVNDLRAQHGCGPLRMHAGLARAATSEARLLLADGRLDHDAGTPFALRLHRAAPSARLVGEDLAWGAGRRALPRSIVRAWMNSPEHRGILMDCRFSHLGVGIAAGRFGHYRHAIVYTADLAT